MKLSKRTNNNKWILTFVIGEKTIAPKMKDAEMLEPLFVR